MAQVIKPPKKPDEERWLTINFDEKAKDALIEGDTLDFIVYFRCLQVDDGADVSSSLIEPASAAIIGLKLTFLAKGGSDGGDYRYEAKVRTAMGEGLVEHLILEVRA